jgi:hypothetical protein
MTSVASTASMSSPLIVRLLNHNSISLLSSPNNQRQETCKGEENAIHNAKRKACFQHCAALIGSDVDSINGGTSQGPEVQSVRGSRGHIGAVGVRDMAELIDAGDEGANEAKIDEGDEECIVVGAVVREECCDGPDSSEDRHNEEYQDEIWCQLVCLGVDVYEVGQHSERRDL